MIPSLIMFAGNNVFVPGKEICSIAGMVNPSVHESSDAINNMFRKSCRARFVFIEQHPRSTKPVTQHGKPVCEKRFFHFHKNFPAG